VKILALDIETRPGLAYVWDLFDKGNTPLQMLVEPSSVICFAAKWVGAPARSMEFYADWKDGHEGMLAEAHRLLSEADSVLTYNGDRFDLPKLDGEFLVADFEPPAPYERIDLYKTARKFGFMSARLAHLLDQLGLAGKLKHEGFGLWKGVMAGDPKAERRMEQYNRRDVLAMEEAYDIIRPWIRQHPSVALHDGYADLLACPRCGGGLRREGFAYTRQSKYQRYQCKQCSGWTRGTKRVEGSSITEVAA
jgi:hypothetical protein